MSYLVLCLRSTLLDDAVRWLYQTEESDTQEGYNTLVEIKETLESQNEPLDSSSVQVIALLPDRDILYANIEVPGRSKSRIRQTAKYALEALIADDIEEMHVAIGSTGKSKSLPCVAIRQDRMQQYMNLLQDCELTPHVMTTLGLVAIEENSLSLIQQESEYVLVTSESIFPNDKEFVHQLLRSHLQSDSELNLLTVVSEDDNAVDVADDITRLSDETQTESISLSEYLQGIVTRAGYIDLLQGAYERDGESREVKGQLGVLLTVTAIALMLVSVFFATEGYWAQMQREELLVEAGEIYQDIYGTSQVVSNPIFRMQEQMASERGGSTWLLLLNRLSNSTAGLNVEIMSLDYQSNRNELSLSCVTNTFNDFETFEQNLAGLGVQVNVNSAEQQDSQVWGRLTLSI